MSAPAKDKPTDVSAWLTSLGLPEYVAIFAENHVGWQELVELTGDELKELGVSSLGHRKKLLSAIKKLCEQPPIASAKPLIQSTAKVYPVSVAASRKPLSLKPEAGPGPMERKPILQSPRPSPPATKASGAEVSVERKSAATPSPSSTRATESPETSETGAAALPAAPNDGAPGLWAKLRTRKFLLISIAVHVIFGLGATFFIVQNVQAKRKLTFQGGPPSISPSKRALEHKVSMAKKSRSGGAPLQTKRIATAGLAKISLPDLPSAPTAVAVVPGMSAGMGGAGLGTGMGFGSGLASGAGTGGGGGGISFFGFRGSGGGLTGNFYDLKQTRSGKSNGMTPAEYAKVVQRFVQDGWRESILNEYFKAPKPLYAPQIMVPNMDAREGPKAFGVEKLVKPSQWVVHYKGRVSPPKSGTFHFVGAGDDIMFVRINGKVVLEGCWAQLTSWRPSAYYDYGFPKNAPRGFGKGDALKLEAGQWYDMEVLIGEQPGGLLLYCLFLEEDGVEYDKDGRGNPILPYFRLSSGKLPPVGAGQTLPPFRPDGAVWRVLSTGIGGSLR